MLFTSTPYMKLRIVGTANRRISNPPPADCKQEISNDEVWNRCAQSFFKNNNDRIPYFDIRYSLFDAYSPPLEDSLFAFSEFLIRFDWPLYRPEAALV
jgi:hypothetical protein